MGSYRVDGEVDEVEEESTSSVLIVGTDFGGEKIGFKGGLHLRWC